MQKVIHSFTLSRFLERKLSKELCAKLRFAAVCWSGIVVVDERQQDTSGQKFVLFRVQKEKFKGKPFSKDLREFELQNVQWTFCNDRNEIETRALKVFLRL